MKQDLKVLAISRAGDWADLLLAHSASSPGERRKVRKLAIAAFMLYAEELVGNGASSPGDLIEDWQWPFDALAEAKEGIDQDRRPGPPFEGLEPWQVLLQKAVNYELD
jgi:hypothetical protein